MTLLFNDKYLKKYRRYLRNNTTTAERILWSRLRARQLYGVKFRRQFSIGPYILDFYCPAKQFAIELDGSQHMQETLYENERRRFLESQNIIVLRFWNADIRGNFNSVLAEIIKVLGI